MSERVNILLGGQGLIGRALQKRLLDRGERVLVYDLKMGFDLREEEPDDKSGETYYWFAAWDVGGAKYIMDSSHQLSILKSNVRLCERVFGCLEKRKAPFTFISSQMAGYPNAYGVSKLLGEYWAKALGAGLVARLWNVYDAEEPSPKSHVIPDLVKQGADGVIRLQTDGLERRQFLHALDCAEGLVLQREIRQPVADITCNEWISILEVANTIGEIMGAKIIPGGKEGYETLVDPQYPLADWRPRIALKPGLQMVIDSMRTQGWI